MNNTNQVLRRVPDAIFRTRVRDDSIDGDNPFRWQDVSAKELFAKRRIIVFALPGAFTPTCSSTHLPRYDELQAEFKKHGIDEIYCLSVNDAFVMYQWSKHIDARHVKMLPDGNGEFSRKMGMLVNKENLGFGMRSWRYAMVVNDGEIEQMFIESELEDQCPTDPFEVSDADTVLAWLRGEPAPAQKPERAAFIG